MIKLQNFIIFDIVEKANRNLKNKYPNLEAIFDLEFTFVKQLRVNNSNYFFKIDHFCQNWQFLSQAVFFKSVFFDKSKTTVTVPLKSHLA